MTLNEHVLLLQDEMIACLQENIRIPSVQGQATETAPYGVEVKECLEHVKGYAEKLGFRTTNVDNHVLCCEYGQGEEMVAVLGHLDVVPAGEGWNVAPYGGEIIDGKIFDGGVNCAGAELGHIVIMAGGRQCSCGRRGCWEAYSSATGLTNMTKEKMNELKLKGIPSLLFDEAEREGKTSARTSFSAMKRGDKYGAEIVDEYIKYLAEGITNIINIFQPEVLTIGGGVCNEKEYLTKPLIEIVEREQYTRTNANKTKILTAVLGNDAGIIGAAGLK